MVRAALLNRQAVARLEFTHTGCAGVRILACVLAWLLSCSSSVVAATPETKRVPEGAPAIESRAASQPEQRHEATEQSPLHARIVQGPDEAASASASARGSYEREQEDLKAQIRSANAAEKQVVLTAWTVGLSALGAFGLFCTIWLSYRSVGEASRAVAAANANTASLISAERAYVKMAHVLPGLQFGEVRTDRRYGEVTVKVTNHGQTPATITDAVVGLTSLESGEPLPDQFPYMKSEEPRARQAFLVPAEWFSFVGGRDFAYPAKGQRQIWVFGHVDYVDIFGQRHRNGWARLYVDRIGDNLIYAEEHIRQYNYDRKRTKDEGNDW